MIKRAILFLNGEHFLCEHSTDYPIFCTDGAINKVHDNLKIEAVIGDFDSLDHKNKNNKNLKKVYLYDQNKTDFEKSLIFLIDKGYSDIDIFFASGGEMDHFLSNLSVASRFYKNANLKFYDKYSYYFFTDRDINLSKVLGKTVSIMPFPNAVISTKGLEYDVFNYEMSLTGNTSVRNKGVFNEATINIISGLVVIFIAK